LTPASTSSPSKKSERASKEDPFSVWISDIIDKVLLGVVVLESLGSKFDPTTGTLEEKPLLLYSQFELNFRNLACSFHPAADNNSMAYVQFNTPTV